jgi:hypothetical protein
MPVETHSPEVGGLGVPAVNDHRGRKSAQRNGLTAKSANDVARSTQGTHVTKILFFRSALGDSLRSRP